MLCSISGRSSWQPGPGGRLVRLGWVWCPEGMVTVAGVCKTTVLLAVEILKLREAEPSIRSRDDRIAEPGRGLWAWAWTLVFSAQTQFSPQWTQHLPFIHTQVTNHQLCHLLKGLLLFPASWFLYFMFWLLCTALFALIWLKWITLFLFCFGLVWIHLETFFEVSWWCPCTSRS